VGGNPAGRRISLTIPLRQQPHIGTIVAVKRIVRLGVIGDGPVAAARQAAILFLLAGVLALAGASLPGGNRPALLVVTTADLALAVGTWYLPWARWHRYATLALAPPAFAIIALSTWAGGGSPTATTPFFVLAYAWMGLHHPPWGVAVLAPVAALAYLVPVAVTHRPPSTLASTVVFVPVVTALGMLIASRVRYLQQAREQVRRVEQWRASMMMTLAHDVRSPLTTVQATLELLAEDDGSMSIVDRSTLTAAALRQTARIARLANGLLDLERIEKGALRLDLHDLRLRTAAEQAASFLNAAGVTIEIDPDTWVHADPERLQQILVNLATNALRHGRPPVLLGAETRGGIVRITVRDHGAGVPPTERPQLFEQFSGAERGAQSVGLGLWIVRQLARAHGGDVSYEPAGPGACFVVTVPCGTPHPEMVADHTTASSTAPAPAGSGTVG
jgi:signal transduction histidine kinase